MRVAIDWPRAWTTQAPARASADAAAGDATAHPERALGTVVRRASDGGARLRVRVSVVRAVAGEPLVDPLLPAQLDGESDVLVREIGSRHAVALRSFVPCAEDGMPQATTAVTYAVRLERAVVLLRLDRAPRDAVGLAMLELDAAAASVRRAG